MSQVVALAPELAYKYLYLVCMTSSVVQRYLLDKEKPLVSLDSSA